MKAGASTLNARTEREMTVTLPNHTGMVTGRRIEAATGGHGVTWNDDRLTPNTVQAAAGHDVASVFTAVDAAGGSTALSRPRRSSRCGSAPGPTRSTAPRSTTTTPARRRAHRRPRPGPRLPLPAPLRRPTSPATPTAGCPSPTCARCARPTPSSDASCRPSNADPARKAGTTILLTSDHGGHGANHDNPRLLDDYRIVVHGARVRGRQGRSTSTRSTRPTRTRARKRTTYDMTRRPCATA